MKESSKNNLCLKQYREFKAIEDVKMRHGTSQVAFQSLSKGNNSSLSMKERYLSGREYGTLLNLGSEQHAHHDAMITDSSFAHCPQVTQQHQFTSGSHYHNVLISQVADCYDWNDNEQNDYCPDSEKAKSSSISNNEEIDLVTPQAYLPLPFSHETTSLVDDPLTYFQNNTTMEDDECVNERVIDNENKLMHIRARFEDATSYWNSTITQEDKVCIELENILRKANAHLHLYDDVMQWAFLNKHSIPSHVPPVSRKTLYAQLSRKIYGDAADEVKPRHIPTTLPSGRQCTISVFNIYSQITQLLLNRNINDWNNYFFSPTPEDPFHLNIFSDWSLDKFDGIETSIWYKRTMDRVISDKDKEILVPICLFIDGTVLSLSGSLSLEPVMFSLMIHNRQTRRNHEAWLPLGYIHDPSNLVGRKHTNTADKYNDYHFMLKLIIKDLSDLVKNEDGIAWHFGNVPGEPNGVTKKLIFRLAFIIGDTKGHDILCCRMGSHNNTYGLCRDCNMTTQNADNPDIPCQLFKQQDLDILPEQDLNSLSFLRVNHNAFHATSFGASPYGINCATPIDIIHSILIGLMEYLHKTFTDQLTGRQQLELSNVVCYIASFSSRHVPGFQRMDYFKKGLFRKGIMTAKMRLARCYLVFLALKTKRFKSFLRNKKGKLPSAVSRRMKQLKKEKEAAEKDESNDVMTEDRFARVGSQDDQPTVDECPNNIALDDESEAELSDCVVDNSNSDCGRQNDEYCADIDQCNSSFDDSSQNSSTSDDTSEDVSDNDDFADENETPVFEVIDGMSSDEDSLYDPFLDLDNKDPIVFTAM